MFHLSNILYQEPHAIIPLKKSITTLQFKSILHPNITKYVANAPDKH